MNTPNGKTYTIVILCILAVILAGSWVWRSFRTPAPVPEPTPGIVVTPPPIQTPEEEVPSLGTGGSESTTPRVLRVTKQEDTPGADSSNPQIKLGKQQIEDLKFKDAQTTFTSISAIDPVARYYQGILAAYYGDRDTAKASFQDVLSSSLDTHTKDTAQRFLDTYTYFESYRDGPPEFLDALISRELLAARELELAIDKLRFITEHNTEYTDAWILLGSAYIVRGKYEDALISLQQSLPSDKPEAYYWLGNAYLHQDNPQKALAAFTEAEKRGYPERYKIHDKIGDCYVLLRQYRNAVKSYEKALSLETTLPELYVRPVWLYIELLHDPDNALKLARQGATVFPDNASAHNLVGWAYLAQEDYPRAKIELELAKQIDPDFAAAYLNLGKYYEAVEDTQQALDNFEKAVQLDPDGSIGKRAEIEFKRIQEKS